MINTTAIKNLSIAYEALGHTSGAEELQRRIHLLLETEITKAETRQREQDKPLTQIDNNDDIPF